MSNTVNPFSAIEKIVRESHGLTGDKIVLDAIIAISREMPSDTTAIDGSMAVYLAGRFLNGIDMCGELVAMASAYELKCDVLKKKSFGEAMIIRGLNKGLKTAKEKEMYAYTDNEYIEAADKLIQARMFKQLVEEKKSSFEKAHYLMKRISEEDREVGTPRDDTNDIWIQNR